MDESAEVTDQPISPPASERPAAFRRRQRQGDDRVDPRRVHPRVHLPRVRRRGVRHPHRLDGPDAARRAHALHLRRLRLPLRRQLPAHRPTAATTSSIPRTPRRHAAPTRVVCPNCGLPHAAEATRRPRERRHRPARPLRRPHPRPEVPLPVRGPAAVGRRRLQEPASSPREVRLLAELHQAARRPPGEIGHDPRRRRLRRARRARRRPEQFTVQTKPRTCRTRCGGSSTTTTTTRAARPRADVALATGAVRAALAAGSRTDGAWPIGNGSPATASSRFDNPAGAGDSRFDPDANPQQLRLHRLARLRRHRGARIQRLRRPANNVSDLKLTFHYDRQRGDGPLRVGADQARRTRSTAEILAARQGSAHAGWTARTRSPRRWHSPAQRRPRRCASSS